MKSNKLKVISIKSKLKSNIKSLNKIKNKDKIIIPVGIGAVLGILGTILILKTNKKNSIKKLNITHEILSHKIQELEQKLKNEKLLHQVLIKNLDEKEQKKEQTTQFKRATINKNELNKLKKEKQDLEELIKKYDKSNKEYEVIRSKMKNELDTFVKHEKMLINELQNKDKIINELNQRIK